MYISMYIEAAVSDADGPTGSRITFGPLPPFLRLLGLALLELCDWFFFFF